MASFFGCLGSLELLGLLSQDGTVGIAYKVDSDEDIITSSAILHLSINNKKIMSEYLTLVLNSFIVRMQAERDAGGSIINHWKKSEIEKVKIPIIDMDKHRKEYRRSLRTEVIYGIVLNAMRSR